MKILYLHQYFGPPGGPGGTRSYEFGRRLVARGHDVTLITSSARMPMPADGGRATNLDGIEVVVLPVDYDNAMSYRERIRAFGEFAARAATEAMRHSADVILATSTPLTIAIPGLVTRLFTGTPMVFEVRDLWPEVPIAMGALRNPAMRAAARTLEYVAYHGSARVIALSPGMADGVARAGFPRSRISVIPNCCDLENFRVDEEAGRQFARELLPGWAQDQRLCVYVGSLGPSHDPGWLVQVAAHARELDSSVGFVVAGHGVQREEIEANARRHGVLDHNLWMPGPVPKSDVPLLLAASSVAVSTMAPFPELEHNSANKFFDALAAGRPVATNYGGWQADLLRDYDAGIVLRHDDPRGAAEQLVGLATDDRRLARHRAGARRLAVARFDRDVLAGELETVLAQAAAR